MRNVLLVDWCCLSKATSESVDHLLAFMGALADAK